MACAGVKLPKWVYEDLSISSKCLQFNHFWHIIGPLFGGIFNTLALAILLLILLSPLPFGDIFGASCKLPTHCSCEEAGTIFSSHFLPRFFVIS